MAVSRWLWVVAAALAAPLAALTPRRTLVRQAALGSTACSFASIGALLLQQRARLAAPPLPPPPQGDETQSVPPPLPRPPPPRRGAATPEETRAAFARLLAVRRAVDDAEAHAAARRWEGVRSAVSDRLVGELQAAATVLARSEALGAEARREVGWAWGACGWRRCGAQADAAQALCKLRANLGMIVPLEALFYLDIAKRALDEIVAIGVAEGFIAAADVPHSEYLPRETLEMFLVRDDDEGGDEASEFLEDYEAAVLRELNAELGLD
ncbi:hypothetical protein AB1Y20_016945 [Prymnesium parvum]|uniref:Uncharacterized protein n=1 Tax=Prymnesium parvum TaxID=97485 RepID=A0AB34ICL0_PRYPA